MSFGHLVNTIDWDKLRVFYYVAKIQSFTGASEYLNLSQSALSRSIQLLEERLSFKLFLRTTKKLVLTEQGHILYQTACKIFEEIEASLNQLSEGEPEPAGWLRIRSGPGLLSSYLLPYFVDFLHKYPDIRFSLIADSSVPEFDLIETDVAIRPPIHGRHDLIQRHLLTSHIRLYASPDYLKEFGTPEKPEDLDKHRLISFGDHPEAYAFQNLNWHLTAGAPPGYIREPFIQLNTPQGRLALAQMGVGIAGIAKEHPGIEQSGLVEVLPDLPCPVVDSYYIYPMRLEGSKRIQALGDFLVECCTRDYGPTRQPHLPGQSIAAVS